MTADPAAPQSPEIPEPLEGADSADAVLGALGRAADADIDLAEAALALARLDRPRADAAPYRRHLDAMAGDVRAEAAAAAAARGGESAASRVRALARVIAKRRGYTGLERDFEDPDAANLACVMDVRHGLPVALGIVYIACARRLGWAADGVNFPGRFLVRLNGPGAPALMDPFDGGRRIEAPGLRLLLKAAAGPGAELTPAHCAPMSNRAVLLRLQNNIKARLLRAGRTEDARARLDVMLKIAPDAAALWREAGILHARAENIRAACAALEKCLSLEAPADDRRSAARLLQSLKNRLN